eukprot:COSAG06_NODE_44510_length_363_cov_0.352273_1_plen_70_part_01
MATFTFENFATENNYDFVGIYDGDSAAAPGVGRWSGSDIPPAVTSGGGSLFIQFTSDGIVGGTGFSGTYL